MHDRCCFGTIDTGRVYFTIIASSGQVAQVPDWEQALTYQTYNVPGSNPPIVVTDLIAVGPATVTWTLEFSCQDHYREMRAKLGTEDMLIVPAAIQSHAGTIVEGTTGPYVELPKTTLLELSRSQTEVDGPVTVAATFLRVVDPQTGEVV